jgi:hypothetical protein
MKSFSGSGEVYTVDRSGRTCTCNQFSTEGHCKHLDEVGVYPTKQFTPRTHPTFSQALSGLVKSIRMRRVDDAIYWLTYLHDFPVTEKLNKKAARFRVARRIFIGSAEDGHSISVMEDVASNFKFLCKVDSPECRSGRGDLHVPLHSIAWQKARGVSTQNQKRPFQGLFFWASGCLGTVTPW